MNFRIVKIENPYTYRRAPKTITILAECRTYEEALKLSKEMRQASPDERITFMYCPKKLEG